MGVKSSPITDTRDENFPGLLMLLTELLGIKIPERAVGPGACLGKKT
jgi:hypothetical protein